MNEFWDEGIYHGECCHIFSDDIHSPDCIRRYYEITPLRGERKRIIICNEWLRLKVRENAYKWKGTYRNYNPYEYTIEEIVNEYFPIGDLFYRKEDQSRINPTFTYCICKRPYLVGKIKLFDAVKILIDMQENFNFNEFNHQFIEQAYSQIHEVAAYLDKYAKYKRQTEKIRHLLRHLNSHSFDTENPRRLIELFIQFFEIQTYIISQKQ
jgi:hypothetical protein